MRSLVLASLFVSASAVACPDLSGNYPVCRSNVPDSTPDQNIVISQAVSNGVTTYTTSSTDSETGETTTESIAADGKVIEVEANPDGLPIAMKYSASCADNSLVMDVSLSVEGMDIGSAKSTLTKEGNALVTRTTGNILGEEIAEETICE